MSYIHFYGHTRPYGYFSNFYERSFMVDGKTYSTNEHYFQSKKFEGTPHELIVANADTPSATKRLGGQRSRPLRADWDAVKDDIMFNGVMAKFSQHNDLKQLLLTTRKPVHTITTHLDTSQEILSTVMDILDVRKKAETKVRMYSYIVLGILLVIGAGVYMMVKGDAGKTIIIAALITSIPTILKAVFMEGVAKLQDREIEKRYSRKQILKGKMDQFRKELNR